ncbi:MAG: tetratricopeptide repeat protein [Luteolibacter sp.]
MLTKQVLRAASGWIELGMPDDALEELKGLEGDAVDGLQGLELKLAAQMAKEDWVGGAATARALCEKEVDVPDYFISVAFCLHETGDTEEAKNWLLRGPDSLQELPVFHYNMACYLWNLSEPERAKNHLDKAIELDDSFLEAAKDDKDLVGMEI